VCVIQDIVSKILISYSFISIQGSSMLNNQKLSSGNEGMPLISLKSSTVNSTMQNEELQSQQDASNNNNGDGLIRDYSLPSRCHIHRRHSRWLMSTVVTIIVLGISYYYYISLPSSSSSSSSSIDEDYIGSSDNSNSIRIEELKSAGAGLEGIHNGAVASDHPVCSKIGLDIMRLKGGNAADAAVATVLCLGIANPASSGFGGGSFMLIRSNRSHFESKINSNDCTTSFGTTSSKIPLFEDARETDDDSDDDDFMTEVIDCRETAPQKSSRDMYNGLPDEASSIGGLSIAVPGELKGLELLHSRHGSLKWSEVVDPSRILARDGVIIGQHLASDIKSLFTKNFIRYGDFLGIRHYLSNRSYNNSSSSSDVEYLRKGEILRNPALAETLKQVQKGGADAFYTGEIARKLVTDVQQSGGILTVEDMENYRATIRSPVRADVDGYSVVGVGPPSSGGAAVIGAIRFLSGYQTPFAANADTLSMHRMVEAMRHVFSIRMSLSDPAYSNSTLDAVNDLIKGNYMDTLRAITKDNDTLHLSEYGGPKWAQMHDVDFNQDVKDAKEGDRRRRRLRRQTINNENVDITDNTIISSSGTIPTKSTSNSNSRRRLARPFGYLEDNGTSHLSVVDKDGNSVAITTSINGIFGSLVFSESTGVLLGDTMDDFGVPGKSNFYGLKPSKANFIAPGKRVCIYIYMSRICDE
ncbi:MAG: gamma-glutamyltranspeptidase, partial [Bacillariaceae sp.]|jgi:gamma-glutamyltranspeptidase